VLLDKEAVASLSFNLWNFTLMFSLVLVLGWISVSWNLH